jgi:hypothetical protein
MSRCTPGTSLGTFLIHSPNRSTIAMVGSVVTISWSFTPQVTSIPEVVDISLQPVNSDGPRTFPVRIARNESVHEQYNWLVQSLNDGSYQLRVGMASRDPLLNQEACLQNGEAIGGSSSIFKIVNPRGTPAIVRDRFGPLSAGTKFNWNSVFLIVFALL